MATGGTQQPITRLESGAIKKRKEKTVSLRPWKEGQSTLPSNVYRLKITARAQRRDILKHGDTLHHSDLSFHHN